MKTALLYSRVSTQQQGRSGLGLEAQQETMRRFCEAEGIEVLGEYVEVETGKGFDALDRRPKLAAALAKAKKVGCYVVAAKLDRISRDVAFIATLMAQKVPFVTAEFGFDVDPTLLHVMAAFSERERKMISQRTKAALQAAKARGTILGNKTNLRAAGERGRDRLRAEADRFAAAMRPMVLQLQREGHRTGRALAEQLNARGVRTSTGAVWHDSTVRNLLKRIARLAADGQALKEAA
jgi:DNA invertase Pin-like site-specific DNA recombinase